MKSGNMSYYSVQKVNIPYKSQNKDNKNSAGYFLFNKEVLRKYFYMKR
jgi:hypothetical protein